MSRYDCTCEQEEWTPDTPRGDDGLDHHPKCPADKERPELLSGEPQFTDGQYLVVVEVNDLAKLEWEGYAANVTDALYKALAKHEESVSDE